MPMTSEFDRCLPYLEGCDLPLEKKLDLIQSVYDLMAGIVDVVLGEDSTSIAIEAPEKREQRQQDVLRLGMNFNNISGDTNRI